MDEEKTKLKELLKECLKYKNHWGSPAANSIFNLVVALAEAIEKDALPIKKVVSNPHPLPPPPHFISLMDFIKQNHLAYSTVYTHLQNCNLLENDKFFQRVEGQKYLNWVHPQKVLDHISKFGNTRSKRSAKRMIEYYQQIGEWREDLL